uniref:MARVEL domain-containing protein n=1 Tax=Rhabditophanes sp. KR3021 TaxID=114890 RepID=A0AC35TND7_9BILA
MERSSIITSALRGFNFILIIIVTALILTGPGKCLKISVADSSKTVCTDSFSVSLWSGASNGINGQWALFLVPLCFSLVPVGYIVLNIIKGEYFCPIKQISTLIACFIIYIICGAAEVYYAFWFLDSNATGSIAGATPSVSMYIQGWAAAAGLLFGAAVISGIDIGVVYKKQYLSYQ